MAGFDHAGRVARVQEMMSADGYGAMLLSVGADLPYFTGYEAEPSERLTMLVILAQGDPVLFVPRLEAPRVEPGGFELVAWDEMDDPIRRVAQVTGAPSRILIGDHTWSVFLIELQKELTDATWIPASFLTSRLRIRKDCAEIEALREAAHAVDRVLARLPGEVTFLGRAEIEVSRDLQGMTIEEGHEVASFAIVASGPNGASPHHEPSDRAMGPGDLVVCDFGGRHRGYFSDVTRTFVIGEPSNEQSELHAVVAAASAAGRASVRSGATCEEVDRAARQVIERAGFGGWFIHRTGHGIGLEVHEQPYLVEGNGMPLESGMAFSIEPGVYVPGGQGVRIEDIVICSDDGADVLNRADRALVSVG